MEKIISIEEQIQAMEDMLPVITKGDQPVFEEIVRTLKFSKAFVENSAGVVETIGNIPYDVNDPETMTALFEKNNEVVGHYIQQIEHEIGIPEWAKLSFKAATVSLNMFPEDYKAEVKKEENQPDPDAEEIPDGQVVFIKRESFSNGVRRFVLDVCASTPEGVKRFESLKFRSEKDRDAEIDKHPEGLTVKEYQANKAKAEKE